MPVLYLYSNPISTLSSMIEILFSNLAFHGGILLILLFDSFQYLTTEISKLLWQLLITMTNDYTSSKSLKLDIKWKVHKRTRQEVFAKLESYIYRIHIVHATSLCLPYFLLKATMLYTYVLTSSSRPFYYVLGL